MPGLVGLNGFGLVVGFDGTVVGLVGGSILGAAGCSDITSFTNCFSSNLVVLNK